MTARAASPASVSGNFAMRVDFLLLTVVRTIRQRRLNRDIHHCSNYTGKIREWLLAHR